MHVAALPFCRSFSSSQYGQRTLTRSVADTHWAASRHLPRLPVGSAPAGRGRFHQASTPGAARSRPARRVPLGSLSAWFSDGPWRRLKRGVLSFLPLRLLPFSVCAAGGSTAGSPQASCWAARRGRCQADRGGHAADPVDRRGPCEEKAPPPAPARTRDWPFLPEGRPAVPWPASQL